MRRVLPLLGCFPALALAFQQAIATFVISGTIVEHATNRPLAGVLVILSPTTARDRQLSVVTGADGRFSFTDLPAAKYSLLAQRRGEREPEGYQGSEGYSTGVATGPGFQTENLIFPLEAPASIAGIVIDEDGDPVRQANVILLRKWISSGKQQVNQTEGKMTGSSGRFRFAHLAPGTYFIAVQARPWYAQGGSQPENSRDLDVVYPVTYDGDTTNGAAAAPITLAEGASITVQIDLRAVPAIHVPITGVESAQGGMATNANVVAVGPGDVPIAVNAFVGMFNNSYELTGLAPGRYMIELYDQAVRGGWQKVDLTSGSALSLGNISSISVSGQVTFDGVERPQEGAGVVLSNGGEQHRAFIQQDGSFSFPVAANPPPGRYEVYIQNIPDGYTKSVTAKGAVVSGDTVEIPSGASVQLSVVVGKGVRTKLDGIALEDGKPISGAMILLLPQDLNRSLLIRRDQSDSDGTFTLPEIGPGRYTLLGIDNGRDLAYEDPAVIKPYLANGQVIDMPLKSDTPVKVNVVGRKRE